MDVKAGATVGFITAIGGLAGAVTGAMFAGILDAKESSGEKMTAYGAGAGALIGAFLGGTVVSATPTTPAVSAAPAPSQLPR